MSDDLDRWSRRARDGYLSTGLYSVQEERDPFGWSPDWYTRQLYGFGYPIVHTAWRDANATVGTWPEVITLEHVPVVFDPEHPSCWVDSDGDDLVGELLVPCFEPDRERVAWRRRKWWGRGPIYFSAWGRAAALVAEGTRGWPC